MSRDPRLMQWQVTQSDLDSIDAAQGERINPFLIDPAVRATAKPAAAEVALSAAGGEVRASTYAPDYVPPRGWIVAAADEPQIEGARLLIADRLGFDPAGRQAWLALPSDPREWKQSDTYGRVEIIKEWIVSECNAIMRAELKQSTRLRVVPAISTLGD